MTLILLAVIKILIMVGFLLNMAALATWADRRQSAMVQDRVGPNRAVVKLPSMVVRLILLLPPALFAVIAGRAALLPQPVGTAADAALLAAELSVLAGWFSALVLCFVVRYRGAANGFDKRIGGVSPRSILVTGLVLHVVALVAIGLVPGPMMQNAARAMNGLLAVVLAVVAVYSAAKVPEGTIGIRLAGTLHAIADTIKMVWKEDFIPPKGDKILHGLAPILSVFPVLVTCAVIPFGRSLCFADVNRNSMLDLVDLTRAAPEMGSRFQCPAGHAVHLQIADLNVGLLYIFAMAGTGVIGAAIAGWASDNKWSLLGGLRAASQMVSYEVAMGISLIGLLLIYGTVRLGPAVEWQGENAWGIFVQPFGFLLFLTALLAETKRVPFDQPEGESEIVAGYFVEYSGLKWGMFMTGEYVEVITSSILLVTLFFGGYALPFMHNDGIRVAFGDAVFFTYKMNHIAAVVISVIAFFSKVIVVAWLQVFIRWTVPRFRYDQLMKLGWTRLLPLAIVNMLLTAICVLAVRENKEVEKALSLVADITQAVVAVGLVAAVLAMFFGIVEPVKREKLMLSTAQRFAAAAGGVRMSERQA